MLEELLIDFNKKHSIPYEFIQEASGDYYFLEISPEFRIEMRPIEEEGKPKGIFLRANLFLLLDPDRETLFRKLLEANYLYQTTMGFALGMDPNERYITLSAYIYSEIDKNSFWYTLEHFCNAIDFLRHNFEKKS
ncbi:MAG: type III secretion system chaperone [Chlamydiia bacterium]